MSNVVPFPREQWRHKVSGVRVAYFDGRWCVERLAAGFVTDRRFMPSQSDAQRIALRISRRDKVMLLTSLKDQSRPWLDCPRSSTPDDAA